ncbi:hypothetical protein [Micromonospora sonneratiae]|uniref:Uncharacterized protein n=1 Tax=Micromonospora sonneratiae TaxID=1184706 RepID=A0ABW3YMS2_9ACTN
MGWSAVSVYLSAAVRAELAAAQEQLDRHTPSSGDDCCTGCDEAGPCAMRRAALRVFGRYGCPPRRWPGASRPELIAGGGSWAGWLTPPAGDGLSNG